MNKEPILRPAPSLQEIHATLRALYEREYSASPPPYLFEILLPKLPENTRKLVEGKLDTIIQKKIGAMKQFADLTKEERRALAAFFDKEECRTLAAFFDEETLQEHLEVGRDSILSSATNPVTHCDTQSSLVAHQLITIAAGKNPAYVERMGCVFFDADGTKTIVDCTSHAHAGKYLEGLAAFLCHPPSPVQQWLQEHHLCAKTYSYAGDELVVIVHSDAQTIDKKTLDAFALQVQEAIARDTHLASFVSFNDPMFMRKYYKWTNEECAAYKRDPASMKPQMDPELPERFIPSVSYGSATFLAALREALSPDTEEANTLEELGVNAFRHMVDLADTRLQKDKDEFRKTMKDPRWKAFLLRNNENRRLMSEVINLRQQLERFLATMNALPTMQPTGDTEGDSA